MEELGIIVRPTPKQIWSIVNSNARINVWEGSVRSGKTTALNIRFPAFARRAPKGELFYIGRSLGALERNVLKQTKDILGAAFDYSLGKGKAWVDGREISLISAYDEASYKKIRGSTVAGWCGDELTLWPENFWRELLHRMSPPGAKGFGSTNTDSPFHWLKADLDRWRELGWQRFRFLLEDNTFLSDEYVAALKRENVGLWYQRFILSLWVLAAGVVFDMFDEDKTLGAAPGYFPHYGVAVDYGAGNPTVFGLFGWGRADKKIWLINLYYYDSRAKGRQKTDEQYVKDFLSFTEGVKLDKVVVDPSALSFIIALKQKGVSVTAANNAVKEGNRYHASCLASGRFRINRIPALEPVKKEYGAYIWDEKAQARGEDKPVKANDHCMDLIRYMLMTVFYRSRGETRYKIGT